MHSLSVYGVALLAGLAAATPLQKRGKTFTVSTRKRSVDKRDPNAGPDALIKAYRKYGFKLPAIKRQAANATAGGQSGAAQAVPEPNQAEYLTNVNIGGQDVMLDFDTGSSDLWVFSTALSQQTIGQHAAFDPAQSQTFQPMQGATWQIRYGDGSGAAGTVGMDTVTIGGVAVQNQAVEMANAISQSFAQDTNNDGLVGLAFSQLNTVQPTQQKTVFDNMMPQLAMPLFTADLRTDATGAYTFGAIDQTAATQPLTNVPVDSTQGFWTVQSNAFAINGQVQQNPTASPAIADTGTSLMLVDDAVAQTYYQQVQGAVNDPNIGGFVYPCNTQLPDFAVQMGPTYMANIPGNGVTFAQVDDQTCFGGIQSTGQVGAQMQIYGDVMFKAQLVVFDGGSTGQPQLMMAPKQ